MNRTKRHGAARAHDARHPHGPPGARPARGGRRGALHAHVLSSLIVLLALAGCDSPTEPDPYRDVPSIAGINYVCPAGYGVENKDCIHVGSEREITVGEGRVHLRGTLPVTADCAWWRQLLVYVTYPDAQTARAGVHTEYVFYVMRCYGYWYSSSFDLQPGRHHISVTAYMDGVDETDELIINCPRSGASLSARPDGGTAPEQTGAGP